MKTFLAAMTAGLLALAFSPAAQASPNEITLGSLGAGSIASDVTTRPTTKTYSRKSTYGSHSAGARPGKWCGWWMRTQFGGGPEYNLARNWSKRGVSAGGPQVGAIVVWPHHVGYITGRAANGHWIVKSGNDGGRVRERARSVSGAIAFRLV